MLEKKVDNGERTRFWEVLWSGDKTLAQKYPRLCNITFSKNITVSEVVYEDLTENSRSLGIFEECVLMGETLSENGDKLIWELTKSG